MTTDSPVDESDWALTACGLWECGHCHAIVSETHFYMDRATGVMQHHADPIQRKKLADRCGWSFNYDDAGTHRCARPYWQCRGEHNPHIHGYGGFSERTTRFGLIPPHAIENGVGPEYHLPDDAPHFGHNDEGGSR